MTWLQQWTDVLFLHFRVSVARLRECIPRRLDIDTYAGEAWVSYVLFRLRLRPAWFSYVPGFSSLLELHVRTYVRHDDQPGIFFLRMYADNRLAILASQLLTPLYYESATIATETCHDGSRTIDCQAAESRGSLSARFRTPSAPMNWAVDDPREAWLVERYRLFVAQGDAQIVSAHVVHPAWQIKRVDLCHYEDGLRDAKALGFARRPDLAHFSPGVTAKFNAFARPIEKGPTGACGQNEIAGTRCESAISNVMSQT